MYLRFIAAAFFIASSSAFQVSRPAFAPHKVSPSSTARYIIMSDEETSSILQSAEECAAGECSIDDVNSLVSDLKDQEKQLTARLDEIMNMIAHLQHINEKEERQTNEVKAFVRDMLRVFDTHKPLAFPTGFAGDIGDGPMTAYDALPPKKWTAKP